MLGPEDRIWKMSTARQLAEVLVDIDDPGMMQSFLRDVMTENEIIEISSRLEAARMLRQGARYVDIVNETKLSSRTIARISDWLQNGAGGYAAVLDQLELHHRHTSPERAV